MKHRRQERGQMREHGHTEPGFKASPGKAVRSSGSPRHTETVGAGPVPGAGEYEAKGPGCAAVRSAGLSPDLYPSDKTPMPPKGVKNNTRGIEEDE